MICRICQSERWEVIYQGPIRIGKFGQYSPEAHTIYRCQGCQAGFLPRQGLNYATDDYRQRVDGAADVDHFFRLHDQEQAQRLHILGTADLRGKTVADIGCGAGALLDFLAGVAGKTIAIEPAQAYQARLAARHVHFPYAADALGQYAGQVDVALCLAVVEHIDRPVEFLREIRELLAPDGYLLLSTPNLDDWLIDFLPGVYDRFFFRWVHTWYFNQAALQQLAQRAGFSRVEVKYHHRFDLSNALHWLRDQRPTGLGRTPLLKGLDRTWAQHLEDLGRADFIYAWLY